MPSCQRTHHRLRVQHDTAAQAVSNYLACDHRCRLGWSDTRARAHTRTERHVARARGWKRANGAAASRHAGRRARTVRAEDVHRDRLVLQRLEDFARVGVVESDGEATERAARRHEVADLCDENLRKRRPPFLSTVKNGRDWRGGAGRGPNNGRTDCWKSSLPGATPTTRSIS
jgi:hypothetical protein